MSGLPDTETLIQRYLARSSLTREELLNLGVDCLHFIAEAQDKGMDIGLRDPAHSRRWSVVLFNIPGLLAAEKRP